MITLLTFWLTLTQANDETEDIRIFVEGMVCSFVYKVSKNNYETRR